MRSSMGNSLVWLRENLAAAFSGLLPPGIIDEDLAHGSGRHAEEVRPVFPGRIGMVDELEVGFVHQRRGVERVVFALEIALLARQLVELVVDQRQQLLEGLAIAVAVVLQQLGNLC